MRDEAAMQGTNHRTSMRTTGGLLLVLLCATLGGAEEALSITDRLELAAFEGDVKMLQEVLAEDELIDLDSRFENKATPLILAAALGHRKVVDVLLAAQEVGDVGDAVDVNAKDGDGATALIVAAVGGHRHVVRSLLKHPKTNANAADKRGQTALMSAAYNGHDGVLRDLARVLKDKKLDVNRKSKEGYTALIMAAMANATEADQGLACVDELMAIRKVKASIVDDYGLTALMWAATNGNAKCVTRLMVDPSCNPNKRDDEKLTALMRSIVQEATQGVDRLPVVKALLGSKRTDCNLRAPEEVSSLSLAAFHKRKAVVKLLLRHEDHGKTLKIGQKDNMGRTAQDTATMVGAHDIADMLYHAAKERGDETAKPPRMFSALGAAEGDGAEAAVGVEVLPDGSVGGAEVEDKYASEEEDTSYSGEGDEDEDAPVNDEL